LNLASVLVDILDALGKGFSATEIIWDTAGREWSPARMVWRDPRWFTFDWISGEQLLVRTLGGETLTRADVAARGESHLESRSPALHSGRSTDPWRGAQPMTATLEPFKFVVHMSKAKSGLPIRGGLARAAGWSYLFKNYVLKDWVTFAEVFGQPLRLGKYGAGATESDKQALLTAVANIGTDAAAIVPDSMLIEFVEARQTGTAELYERFCEYLDRQVSKAVLGQTLTTEVQRNTGSRAAAQVHDAVRRDILAADARRLGETLTRDLVKPLVDLNCGPQKRYPHLDLLLPNDQDDRAFADIIAEMTDRGLRISQRTILDRLNLPAPGPDDEILTPVSSRHN
jgi:phage gp29-like protein